MPSINFSGLSSGIDSGAIIDQLVAVERSRADIYEQRKLDLNAQLSTVGDLISKLQSLEGEADKLDTGAKTRAFTGSTTDESQVAVSVTDDAVAGSYTVKVNQLATPETSASQTYATADAGVAGVGSVTITAGSNPAVQVDYDATHSLADIATMISDQVDGASAQVLYDGSTYRILVSADEPGSANSLSFSEAGAGLGMTEIVAAQDSEIELNGITVTRSTNELSDVLSGVTLELNAITPATGSPATVSVERDTEGSREKMQEFVDSYNAVASLLDRELSYNGEQKGRHTLFGDSTLRGLESRLSGMITTAFPHGSSTVSMGMLGIELAENGTLTIDSTKFDAAVAADPEALEHLMGGDGANGLAAEMAKLVDDYTRAGDGVLVSKKSGMDDRIDVFDQQIERIEERAADYGERMLREFTALESLMSSLRNQAGFLNSIVVYSHLSQ